MGEGDSEDGQGHLVIGCPPMASSSLGPLRAQSLVS